MTTQILKQRFLAMRNGVIADTLRQAGMPYKVIFGLNVPQLAEIARSVISDREVLAQQLWDDREVRESRLLACWLFDTAIMPRKRARQLMEDVRTREEADILAFRALRNLPYASELVDELAGSSNPLTAYAADALARNVSR